MLDEIHDRLATTNPIHLFETSNIPPTFLMATLISRSQPRAQEHSQSGGTASERSLHDCGCNTSAPQAGTRALVLPAAPTRASVYRSRLESQLYRRIEHPAFTAQRKGYRCIAHRRAEQIERLPIPAQHAVLIREPVRPNTRFIRTAILTQTVRPARTQLQPTLTRHLT